MVGLIISPSYYKFKESSDLDAVFNLVNNTLTKSQNRSQFIFKDSNWGIKLLNNQLTTFKGASYATRDTSADEKINLPPNITVSGLTEIVFSKLKGYPNVTGTISLINNSGQTKNIIINEKGSVSY